MHNRPGVSYCTWTLGLPPSYVHKGISISPPFSYAQSHLERRSRLSRRFRVRFGQGNGPGAGSSHWGYRLC